MRFDIMTVFPDLVRTVLGESILGRAQKNGVIQVFAHNIRDYTKIQDLVRELHLRRKFFPLYLQRSFLVQKQHRIYVKNKL